MWRQTTQKKDEDQCEQCGIKRTFVFLFSVCDCVCATQCAVTSQCVSQWGQVMREHSREVCHFFLSFSSFSFLLLIILFWLFFFCLVFFLSSLSKCIHWNSLIIWSNILNCAQLNVFSRLVVGLQINVKIKCSRDINLLFIFNKIKLLIMDIL